LKAGLALSAAAAVALPAVDVFLSSAPARLTGMTTGDDVLVLVLDLPESGEVDGVDDELSSPANIRSLAICTRQQPRNYSLNFSWQKQH